MSALGSHKPTPLAHVIDRWDDVVLRWNLTADERSSLLGEGAGGSATDAASYGAALAERRMRLVVALDPIVSSVFEGDSGRVRDWLRRPNPNLSHRTPVEVMTASPEWLDWLVRAVGASA